MLIVLWNGSVRAAQEAVKELATVSLVLNGGGWGSCSKQGFEEKVEYSRCAV